MAFLSAGVDADFPATQHDRAPAAGGSWLGRIARSTHLWAPLLIVVVLAAPSVTFMLPATRDSLDEIYQPLQALKFFKTHGKAYHKYGPMPNFLLAPGYGASLAYWKLTGSFNKPSEDFPYGFARPFEQMGMLIFQGRLLFLILSVVALAYLAYTLQLATDNRWAVAFALLFTVATNWALVYVLPSPRPDSPMLAFAALALAVYIRILFLGLTTRRGIWLSLWAVCAISSKELAAPMFVLPYLGLIVLAWRDGNRQTLRAMAYCLAAGVVAYALLNIVYAPHTWLQRMNFWLLGPGIDSEVWGGGGIKAWIMGSLACMLDNLGPGGAIAVFIALATFVKVRPPRWLMLALPAISIFALGLARIHYPADRFYTILSLALFPLVACGLSQFRLERAPALAALGLLAIVNLWFATFSWDALRGVFEETAERHAVAHVSKGDSVSLLNTFPWNPGSTRLEYLGYRHDPRSIQQLASQRTNLPRWIYTTQGRLQFIEDAKKMPARAAMMKRESGFDPTTWNGMEPLGYTLDQTIIPSTPAWFPFDWMPSVRQWKQMHAVLVYRRSA